MPTLELNVAKSSKNPNQTSNITSTKASNNITEMMVDKLAKSSTKAIVPKPRGLPVSSSIFYGKPEEDADALFFNMEADMFVAVVNYVRNLVLVSCHNIGYEKDFRVKLDVKSGGKFVDIVEIKERITLMVMNSDKILPLVTTPGLLNGGKFKTTFDSGAKFSVNSGRFCDKFNVETIRIDIHETTILWNLLVVNISLGDELRVGLDWKAMHCAVIDIYAEIFFLERILYPSDGVISNKDKNVIKTFLASVENNADKDEIEMKKRIIKINGRY